MDVPKVEHTPELNIENKLGPKNNDCDQQLQNKGDNHVELEKIQGCLTLGTSMIAVKKKFVVIFSVQLGGGGQKYIHKYSREHHKK